jgi:accessory gene regulator B
MMRFINKWSYRLADYLTSQLGHSHEKRHVYYYGFQIIIGGIVKFLLLLAATLATGIFFSTFTALLFFGALRVIAGGYHMGNYTRCMIVSSLMFMLSGFITEYTHVYWSQAALALLAGAVFLVALPSVLKWAPADTPYKPITKPSQIKTLKVLSVVVVILWALSELLLIAGRLSFYSLAGSLGILMAVFIISPAGYGFFNFAENIGRKPGKSASQH